MAEPAGAFHRHASGLLVPQAHARTREVWTRDEWRILERMMTLFDARGVDVFLGCRAPECRTAAIERHRGGDGSMILRCAHKDRVFLKAF